MRAVKRVFTGQIGGGDWVGANWHVVASSNHFQLLQLATSLHSGSWFPKKVELEQVAQLMKTNPKDVGNLYKNAHWREPRLLILEKGILRWMYFREVQWQGNLWKEFEGLTAKWSSATFQLKDLTAECTVISESLDYSIVCLHHHFSTKETRNILGCPEETLFERSPEVGREERPPNAVVLQLN